MCLQTRRHTNTPFPHQFPLSACHEKEHSRVVMLEAEVNEQDNAAENDVLQGNVQSHSAEGH